MNKYHVTYDGKKAVYPFERFIADVKEFKTCKSQN